MGKYKLLDVQTGKYKECNSKLMLVLYPDSSFILKSKGLYLIYGKGIWHDDKNDIVLDFPDIDTSDISKPIDGVFWIDGIKIKLKKKGEKLIFNKSNLKRFDKLNL